MTAAHGAAQPGAEPLPAAPRPFTLYVHDDLSDAVRAEHGADSEAGRLTGVLMELIRGSGERVSVLTLEEQLQALTAQRAHPAFPLTIGIGKAGERVARQVHLRTGWFPMVARVDVTREELVEGGYRLASLGGASIDAQLEVARGHGSLALTDDTVFSGLTMDGILGRLSSLGVRGVRVFCLRGVGETLARLRTRCAVTAGFEASGRLLDEVSFINASGLVRRGSIRRQGQPPLAFFERPEWIEAWFPAAAGAVLAHCRALNALLDARGEGSTPAPGGPPPAPIPRAEDDRASR